MNSIIDAINPTLPKSEGVLFLKYLYFSIISCACCSWAYILISLYVSNKVLYWLLLLLSTTIVSSITALIIASVKQKNLIYKVLKLLKIKSIHHIPSAWDYIFSQQDISYVIVTLLDDTKIKGLYVGGDGAGLTRGLAQAGANGVYVARKIISDINS